MKIIFIYLLKNHCMIHIKLFISYIDIHFEVVSVTLREKFSIFVTIIA